MTFRSILFDKPREGEGAAPYTTTEFFADLNLDQIIDAITAGRQEYDLKSFFLNPLHDIDAIRYRQDIMRDLEDEVLFASIKEFAQKMKVMHRQAAFSDKIEYPYHREGWFLAAAEVYCDAIVCLANRLNSAGLNSAGLLAFREYLGGYVQSDDFVLLLAETKQRQAELATVHYCLLIKDARITVRKSAAEPDYSAEVEAAFEKFRQGAVKDYRAKLPAGSGMNHIEAQVLDFVAQLYPEIFDSLDNYCANHRDYPNAAIVAFEREIQFYIAYLEYVDRLKRAGLSFCYPQMTNQSKAVFDLDGFDLALAYQKVGQNARVICNDFFLQQQERIFVVTGPNQGGKTTFARTFGQLHYMAALGCPIPGREAKLFLFDRLFTHFEKEESLVSLNGKLQDDLLRVHNILAQATANSIIIMNEIFTSTTLNDAFFLSQKVMEKITQLDCLCVCVTFIDELANLNEKTVSLVSTVNPENSAQRTFKLVRKPADGAAYAISIAERYRLTYSCLKERIHS